MVGSTAVHVLVLLMLICIHTAFSAPISETEGATSTTIRTTSTPVCTKNERIEEECIIYVCYGGGWMHYHVMTLECCLEYFQSGECQHYTDPTTDATTTPTTTATTITTTNTEPPNMA